MWKLVLLGSLACGCVRAAKLALLPPVMSQNARDPDLTRPLVATPSSAPAGEGGPSMATGSVGPVGAGVTGATVLSWLLGGAAPLVGIYGTFDENALFDPQAAKLPADPAPVQ
jgi:hypothetical protein